eukprot:scaffold19611_cov42-Phaeocystis_antarctica.AAC.2
MAWPSAGRPTCSRQRTSASGRKVTSPSYHPCSRHRRARWCCYLVITPVVGIGAQGDAVT